MERRIYDAEVILRGIDSTGNTRLAEHHRMVGPFENLHHYMVAMLRADTSIVRITVDMALAPKA